MRRVLALILLVAVVTSAQTVRVQLTDGTRKWYEPLPVTHPTLDHRYILSTLLSAGAMIADVENSRYALDHMPGAVEANPLFGAHPGRGRYYALSVPVFLLNAAFSYRYKREDQALSAAGLPGHKIVKWWLPNAANMGAHLLGLMVTVTATGK